MNQATGQEEASMAPVGRVNPIGQGMDLLMSILGLGWIPLTLFPPTTLSPRINRGRK
ncbi:MAG: hypothetical protein ACHWZW_17570 [Spirulina sp.]